MARLCGSRPTTGQTQTERGNNNNQNPYAKFGICCTSLRTKEHAQLIGIVSLSVFVCLIVVSYSMFGAFAVVYIASGIIIYGFLMESLLRKPNKIAILGYITFEALQIAFYLSLAIYILIPLVYSSDFDWSCDNSTTSKGTTNNDNNNKHKDDDCVSKVALIEILIFLIFLITMKAYFTRIMLHLYKFYVWMEQHSGDVRASYVNNCGVQINIDDHIFPPPPVWTPDLYSTGVSPLPTYDEATNIQKPPVSDESTIEQTSENRET